MELDPSRIGISQYRMETAYIYLNTAKNTLELGDCRSAANRSYYAVFQAIRAVLVLDGADFKKHSAVLSRFRETYIKTEIFSPLFSEIIGTAFYVRQKSDYDDFYLLSKESARKQVADAEFFLDGIKAYLSTRVKQEAAE